MTSSTTYRWIIKIIIMTFRWILLARDYPRARADVNCFGARASVQCKYKVLMFYPDAWRTPILTCLHMSLILRNARAHQPANFFSLKLIFFFAGTSRVHVLHVSTLFTGISDTYRETERPSGIFVQYREAWLSGVARLCSNLIMSFGMFGWKE